MQLPVKYTSNREGALQSSIHFVVKQRLLFDLTGRPRPVSCHVELVECGWDPRRVIRGWRMLEAAYDVLPTSPERIRVLIATTDSDESLTIATTLQACCFRQHEEFSWSCSWEKGAIYSR